MLAVILSGCGDEPVAKSSFGSVDPMQDGQVLAESIISDPAEDDETEDGSTGDTPSKTAKQLDVNALPAEVMRMAQLCDALNMGCVEHQSGYSSDDTDFMWHCVHIYACNCTDKDMGFTTVGDYIEADPWTINDVLYAMFGRLKEIPQLPAAEVEGGEGEDPHIVISNDLKYRFTIGDRGTSGPDIRRVTQYSDGSMEMEVALIDLETGEETVSFIYTMRSNTRDTTTSALFGYEITGSRAADAITSDKMSGVPFLSAVMQVYGYDSYSEDDSKYNEVEEVLMFNSFSEHVPGIEELNGKISGEILAFANEELDEVEWHEIISYPLTTDNYVQVATTFITYPNYATDPDLRVYNYDKKKSRAMDINDALSVCNMTEAKLIERVRGLFKGQGSETLQKLEFKGFLFRRDGSVDMYYMLYVNNPEAEDYKRLVAYNSLTGTLRYPFEEGSLIPYDETDQMKPPLTHGVKE